MAITLISLIALLFSVGTFLMMRPHIICFAIGFVCFTNGTNLLIFNAGRLMTNAAPPIIPAGEEDLILSANPLSQALILTAIVIGFGFLAFTLVLIFKTFSKVGTIDGRIICGVNEEGK